MSNDLNLGDLGITINLSEGEPASAQFTLPDGSVVTRPFDNGELSMRLGLGLGLGYQPAVGGGGASAPSNTGLPVISGTATSGQTLSTTNGTWNDGGAEISGYAYQWNADGVAIGGATSSTFGLTGAQVGAVITVTVTATNAAGSTAATSAGTAPVAAGFTPLSLPSLNRWYDPSDEATLTETALEIQSMADKSGNGNIISAPSASRRANRTTINGVQALTFNQDFLSSGAPLPAFNGDNLPMTFFAVIQPANVTQDPGEIMSFRGTIASQHQRVFQNAAPVVGFAKTDSASTTKTASGSGINTSAQLITVVSTGTLATVRRNGVAIATNADVGVAGMTVTRFTLAANYNGVSNTNFFIGKIGEVALCAAALGTPEVAAMEAYLAAKWGITI